MAGTERIIEPVGLFFWGHAWSLGAWCQLRRDWRNFRVDRIVSIEAEDGAIPAEHTLEAFLADMACHRP